MPCPQVQSEMLYLQEPSCVALDQKDGVALCAAQAQHRHSSIPTPGCPSWHWWQPRPANRQTVLRAVDPRCSSPQKLTHGPSRSAAFLPTQCLGAPVDPFVHVGFWYPHSSWEMQMARSRLFLYVSPSIV